MPADPVDPWDTPRGVRSAIAFQAHRGYDRIAHLLHELARFGVVGFTCALVDIGLFNVLMYAGGGVMSDKPLTAKIISITVATTLSYFGNRYWAFRHRGGHGFAREYISFFVLNAIAMAIAVGCLWFSHYAIGWDSVLADNISANVVGLGLGTAFRFWSYRRWVFPAQSPVEARSL